jgi:hypothetical protein
MNFAPHQLVKAGALALGLAACGPSGSTPAAEPATPIAPTPAGPTAVAFENPGGMWMPAQMAAHAETLKRLGLELDPAMLAEPTSPLLQAVVSLGGCSASFVSPDGLIITNHHCVAGALAYHSNPERDLVKDGFLAKTRGDELWNGPTSKVWVTQKISDVTPTVLADLDQLTDDRARYDEIEKRTKELVAGCEKDRPGTRCSVARFFAGAEYQLIENLEIKDIRLVYAPAQGVGNFGGDIDNWMWPRHTGDFAFYRAYVGSDGKPADHGKDNQPFKPQSWLKVASRPLAQGDLVMVAGYPGRTNRLATAADAAEALEWMYPTTIARFEAYLAMLAKVGEADRDAAIKAQPMVQNFNNYHKNYVGKIESLGKGGVVESKKQLEAEVKAWIAADPGRQEKYGDVFAKLDAIDAENRRYRERDAAMNEIGYARLLGAARQIVRMAEERAKPDAERDPGYQERNWKLIEAGQVDLPKKYNRNLDKALLTLALERGTQSPGNADWLAVVVGGKQTDAAAIGKRVEALYGKTKLEDDKVRLELLTKATTAKLQKSKDPMIQLALALRPLEKEREERSKRLAGQLSVLVPRYIAALREHNDGPLAPDANSTLRISYGTVRGYRPRPDAEVYRPFTVLSEVVKKHQDKEPFDAPDGLLAAFQAKKLGPYVDARLGEVPVDFLADLDITGGNSGSATLNARGEITGLAFDGNLESMGSDWLFAPDITRSIHVDIRYVQWIMDAVDGADHLLKEMGVSPSID